MTPSERANKARGRGRAAFVMQIETIKAHILRGELLMDIYADLSPFPFGYEQFTKYVARYCQREVRMSQGVYVPPVDTQPPAPPPASISPEPTPPAPLIAGPKVAAAPAQKKFSVSPVLPPKDQLV